MKILFICTHNRCRSILSEAITNQLGEGLITAKSAGSQPSGQVHPLSIVYLQEQGFSTEGLKSQSWDEFEDYAADLVITVCDSAAKEACPVWFGSSAQAHWGLADPSKVEGSDEHIASAFRECIEEISQRTKTLLQWSRDGLDANKIAENLRG